MLTRLVQWADWLSRLVSVLGLAGLVAIAFAIVADVLLRWLFNSPLTGVRDTASLFVAVVIASSFPICCMQRKHITITFIGKKLSPRGRSGLDALGNLVTLILFGLIAWQLWHYTDQLAADNQTTRILGWPVSPWWRGISLIVALCIPVQLVVLLQDMFPAALGKKPSDDSSDPPGLEE